MHPTDSPVTATAAAQSSRLQAGASSTGKADPPAGEEPGSASVTPSMPATVTVLVLALVAILGAVLALTGTVGPVRGLSVGIAALAVPGLALLPSHGLLHKAAAVGAAISLSLVVETVLGLLMVWTRWWYPVPAGAALFLLSAAVVLVRWRAGILAVVRAARARRAGVRARSAATGRRRLSRAGWVALLALVAAGVTWAVALGLTDTAALGPWGLLPAFPALWYAALLVVLALLVAGLTGLLALGERWLAATVGVLAVILYGSVALVDNAPRLPWVFKHIAVTRYIELHGSVDPSIDVYHRWPGFFARSAALGQLAGSPNPVQWAGYAEIWFALLDVVLVLAIARTLSGDWRWCWTATTLFVVTNWLNQNHFAPQALAYSLYLFIALVLLLGLRHRPAGSRTWSDRAVQRLIRPGSPSDPRPDLPAAGAAGAGPISRIWLSAVLLATFAVVVTTHQLTPYLILLAMVPLFVLGYYRPLWVAPVLVVLALGYLVPNVGYIQQNFGVFSGFDPLTSDLWSPLEGARRLPSSVLAGRAAALLTAALVGLALVGLLRRIWAGGPRRALVVGWMMLAPLLLLVAQVQNAEGQLRVYLFALPWCALAAAWAFWPRPGASIPAVRGALSVAIAGLTALFVVVYYQPEADYRLAQGELQAAEWLDAALEPGDVVLTTAPVFPIMFGPHYDRIAAAGSIHSYQEFFPDAYAPNDLRAIAVALLSPDDPHRAFVVFSDDQYRYDLRHGLYDPRELAALEAALRGDTNAERVYDGPTARIYRVL